MNRLFQFYLVCIVLLEISLGILPQTDRLTWMLENIPVWIGLIVTAVTYKRFQLTKLSYTLLFIHSIILMIGGYYSYAEVPLFNWIRDHFHLSRNYYDRLGHLTQGFVPAIVVRELLVRKSPLKSSCWLPFLCICVCLAGSAFYELIEWWVALATGDQATSFLGTQSDVWDTQWDMFCALIGATTSILTLSQIHDRFLLQFDQRLLRDRSPSQ